MINAYNAKRYCSENISLIENYQEAIADQKMLWDVHHRKECDSEGRTLFTKKELKEMNLYFNRPASELIFVTRSMHNKIHRERSVKGGKIGGKKTGPINGKKSAIKRSIPILQFTKSGEFIKEWPSATEAGFQLGISQSSICKCCKFKRNYVGGYIWKYKKA